MEQPIPNLVAIYQNLLMAFCIDSQINIINQTQPQYNTIIPKCHNINRSTNSNVCNNIYTNFN